jgi:hypothetical protein
VIAIFYGILCSMSTLISFVSSTVAFEYRSLPVPPSLIKNIIRHVLQILGTAKISKRKQERRDKQPGIVIVWSEGPVQVRFINKELDIVIFWSSLPGQ